MQHSLEGHKLFPYIAWTLIIVFIVATYLLIISIQNDLNNLNSRVEQAEQNIADKNTEIKP